MCIKDDQNIQYTTLVDDGRLIDPIDTNNLWWWWGEVRCFFAPVCSRPPPLSLVQKDTMIF